MSFEDTVSLVPGARIKQPSSGTFAKSLFCHYRMEIGTTFSTTFSFLPAETEEDGGQMITTGSHFRYQEATQTFAGDNKSSKPNPTDSCSWESEKREISQGLHGKASVVMYISHKGPEA